MKKWLDERILFFAWSFILIICLVIIFTSSVKAASSISTEIPYNVAEYADYNQIMLDKADIVKSIFYSYFPQYSNYSVLMWTQDGYYNNAVFQYYLMFEPQYNNTILENADFSSEPLQFYSDYEIFVVLVDSNGQSLGILEPHSHYASLLGNSASVNTSIGSYLPRYPFYYDGEPVLSTNNNEVLISRVGGNVVSGSATEPDLSGDNIGSDKPDLEDYLPDLPNKPIFDNSSLESMVSSLYDFLVWEYNAITGTLKGYFQYLGDIITYSIQKVIDNIKNFMQNFYNNMKSLFEPLLNSINEILSSISSGIDYIKEPLSGTVIYDNLSGTGIMTNYNATVTAVNSFKDSFVNLSEPSTFTIPIHLENLPSSMFGDLTTQYIDLSVINSVKPVIRTFVWALVTYGLIITIFDSIANYINGGGDE